jgi:hypothetical protein
MRGKRRDEGMRDGTYSRALYLSLGSICSETATAERKKQWLQSYVSVKREWLGNPAVMQLSPAATHLGLGANNIGTFAGQELENYC